MKQPEKETHRITIGLFISGIMDDFSKLVSQGALKVAEELDINLLIFPGKYIDRDVSGKPEIAYEFQYQTLFSYATKHNVDAIVACIGSICCCTTQERTVELIHQFRDIPFLLVSATAEGYPSVMYDNDLGIREGLEYLIHTVGCRKFGLVAGQSGSTDSLERTQTFLSVMKEHNIPIEEKQIVTGNSSRFYNNVFSEFLDNNPDLDAVFCINDVTALGLYQELQKRGIRIGEDISVFGYDDIADAERATPSLSTVRADGYYLGEEAVRMAIRAAKGEKLESRIIPTKFILRDSIKNPHPDKITSSSETMNDYDNIYSDIFHYAYESPEAEGHIREIFSILMNLLALLHPAKNTQEIDKYANAIALVDQLIHKGIIEYADINQLLSFLESSYHSIKKDLKSTEEKYHLRDFFSTFYRRIIKAMNSRQSRIAEEAVNTNISMRTFSQSIMFFENGVDQNYTYILKNMEWIHIKNAYLYLLKQPIYHLMGEAFNTPKELYLKAARINDKVQLIPSSQQKISIKHIFDHSLIDTSKAYQLVLLPLYSNETVYGFLLCDLPHDQYDLAEFVANQLGGAVKMISLLTANEKIQTRLEESLYQLKQNNIALDNLSKSDALTGIYNRRGFNSRAVELFASQNRPGNYICVMYADMNNLKIINDRYGHDEGDFSLNKIACILSESIPEHAIAARIGGDEFAIIYFSDMPKQASSLMEHIHLQFKQFNKTSDKPYNLQISIGCYEAPCPTVFSLEEMLEEADQQLYKVKALRKKEVDKSRN